ncbi:Plc21C [Bugula neritina]|uniref:Plc21C n=1 Tax=Bugula neritina TaxID=10212 RepID=A0A7J7JPE2_BUGNE|nr:Plc21C [Bugula neritina]
MSILISPLLCLFSSLHSYVHSHLSTPMSILISPLLCLFSSLHSYVYSHIVISQTQYIDISQIRDTRTGKFAKSPKFQEVTPPSVPPCSAHVESQLTIASGLMNTAVAAIKPYKPESKMKDYGSAGDSLEDKTLTICTGTDFVNLTWTTFVFDSATKAMLWTDELLKYSRNPVAANGSAMHYLEKIYARTKLAAMENNKQMTVKGITQLFATHKEDRKRVHLALKSVNLPCESKDNISSEDFTFQHFLTFYLNLCERTELNEIFNKL